jgi:hypothetical protein
MSFTLQFVDVCESDLIVQEYFITFQETEETTGQSLFVVIKKLLEDSKLDFKNCRDQGCDNGLNMRRENKGVQARIRQENPRAFFMPCGCHSLNLVTGDSEISSTEAASFFSIIQHIYILFSASVGRWKILKDNVPTFTVKPLCNTRWECQIDCLKPLRYQIAEIHNALVSVNESSSDPAVKHEALTLSQQICDFSFIVMLVIWYDVLHHINIVSKMMQSSTKEINSAVQLLESCTKYLTEYWLSKGFERAVVDAKQLDKALDIEPIFVENRLRHKKHMVNYEGNDKVIINSEQCFRINVFNKILDNAVSSLQSRFEQTKKFQQYWRFYLI